MDGDRMADGTTRKASVTDFAGNTWTDSDWLDGEILQVRQWQDNGDGSLTAKSSERYTYWAAETARPGGQQVPAWMVRPEGDYVTAPMLDGQQRTSWTITDGYSTGNAGLATRSTKYGDGTDWQCTTTLYAQNRDKWLMDYPAAVEVHADGPAGGTTCAGPVTAKTITFYDGAQSLSSQPDRGNPTLVKVYTDPVHYSATATTYDSSGRVTSVTDPLGRTTTTSYEPPTGIPFSAVTTTDPLGYKSTSVVSLPFGSAVEQTDPNGNLTQTSYDALGRLTEVAEPALPGTAGGTTVTQKFGYSLVFTGTGRVSQAPVVTSSQLLDDQDGGRWVDSYAYLDGYGRTRQTDTASPYGDGRIAAVASYDARGLMFAASLPFWTSGKPGSGMIDVAADAIPSLTTTTYDGLQRPVQENLESMGRVKWHTGYRYAADVTVVTPPAGGATATWTDAYGRTVKIQQNYPVRRGSVPLNLATTRYGYNDAGQLATITGPDGAVTSYGYDWAGNKTSADDPDAGDTAYTYDAAGQLTSQTDADGVTTSTTYDELGRRTGLWDGNPVTGTRLAAWTYDTAPGGKGMLATSASYSGGKETYADTVAGYDPRGEVTGEKITIPPDDGGSGLAGSYSYGYGYDEAGNQVSMAYPAAGGLSQETVTTGYDAQGLPDSLASGTGGGYVQASSYGPAGRLTGRTLGGTPATSAVTRGYTWDESTGNLAGVTTATRGGGQIQDDTYTYDPAGDLLSDHDQTAGQWQCYGYDQFPRLTQAWTARTGCGSGVRGYDPAQPGAYQQSFSYSIAGNTTALTTGTATTTPQVTRYTYPAFSQPHPHAPVSVGAASFAYDRDGNLTRQVTGRIRQLYDWDPLSQLASVTSYQPGQPAQETSFAYDAAGDRLIRRDPDGTVTLYLPGMDLASDGTAVTATRYYSISGTTVAARTSGPGAGLSWLTGNPQGSPPVRHHRRRHQPNRPAAVPALRRPQRHPDRQGHRPGVPGPAPG
jgi:YD repeat-containing protein